MCDRWHTQRTERNMQHQSVSHANMPNDTTEQRGARVLGAQHDFKSLR
jgi:hypothetical protein